MDLKVRRIRTKTRQAQIAKLVDRSRSWVARVENDDFQDPEVYVRYETALRTFENVSDVA